jgi:hypothetical protein
MHEICGFFGITPEMFDRVYGHHHPDYQTCGRVGATKLAR